MKREDILLQSVWVEGRLDLHSELFQKTVPVNLFASDRQLRFVEGPIISERLVESVNDFLQLGDHHRPALEKIIHEHCLMCCESVSWGFDVKQGETESEANLREFGVTDAASAFDKSNLHSVWTEDHPSLKNRLIVLHFLPEWEQEHGLDIVLKNEEVLDGYFEGLSDLHQFDR